jgi:hypothetical protein
LFALGLCSCVAALTPLGEPNYNERDDENFQDFMDVPTPSVMAVETGAVEIYERRGVLAGKISLMGKLTVDELLDYFDRHLPNHGWTPLAEAQTERAALSTWAKAGKTLTIRATQPSLSLGVKSNLEIWVSPPHSKEDLGHRVIYNRSDEPRPSYRTTPIRTGGGFGSSSGVAEEDI